MKRWNSYHLLFSATFCGRLFQGSDDIHKADKTLCTAVIKAEANNKKPWRKKKEKKAEWISFSPFAQQNLKHGKSIHSQQRQNICPHDFRCLRQQWLANDVMLCYCDASNDHLIFIHLYLQTARQTSLENWAAAQCMLGYVPAPMTPAWNNDRMMREGKVSREHHYLLCVCFHSHRIPIKTHYITISKMKRHLCCIT